jgi:hypothetical protein
MLFLAAVAFSSVAAWCVGSLPDVGAGVCDPSRSLSSPILMEVIEKRYDAADDLLMHRKTIPQTVARFREIAQDDPIDVLRALRDTFPDAASEDDLFFMQVISYVETQAARRNLDETSLEPIRQEWQRRQAARKVHYTGIDGQL